MSEWIEVISQVGFPVAVSVFLIVQNMKQEKTHADAIAKITESQVEQNEKWRMALENSTAKISETLGALQNCITILNERLGGKNV